MHLHDYLDPEKLNQMILEQKVSVRHTGDLRVYDYTKVASFSKDWNDVTIKCRGLIVDKHDRIVGRGFDKFFNYNEVSDQIPYHLDYEVYEKMDGSLIIAFHHEGKWICSTRGALDSYQADLANKHIKLIEDFLTPTLIYNFELIHPTNSIVVNYGNKEDLVCLAVYCSKTLEEKPLDYIHKHLSKVEQHKVRLEDALNENRSNREGYVLKYSNGFRVKVKHREYCMLHRLKCEVTSVNIWKMLMDGHSLDEIQVYFGDEEFWDFIEQEYRKINEPIQSSLQEARKIAESLSGSSKENALWVNANVSSKLKAAVFALLKGNEKGAYRSLCKYYRPVTNLSAMQTENGHIYKKLLSQEIENNESKE